MLALFALWYSFSSHRSWHGVIHEYHVGQYEQSDQVQPRCRAVAYVRTVVFGNCIGDQSRCTQQGKDQNKRHKLREIRCTNWSSTNSIDMIIIDCSIVHRCATNVIIMNWSCTIPLHLTSQLSHIACRSLDVRCYFHYYRLLQCCYYMQHVVDNVGYPTRIACCIHHPSLDTWT